MGMSDGYGNGDPDFNLDDGQFDQGGCPTGQLYVPGTGNYGDPGYIAPSCTPDLSGGGGNGLDASYTPIEYTSSAWDGTDLYGIGNSGGSINETSDFGDLSLSSMADSLDNWSTALLDFEGDSTAQLEGPILLGWQGSEYESQQNSYLKELSENYKSMSIDVLNTRAKTQSDKKQLSDVTGKTNLVGSGTINRANKKLDNQHKESVYDSYSDFLENKSGIVSDISKARQSWWDFNQDQTEDALMSDTF
jgi:hypothetical protein